MYNDNLELEMGNFMNHNYTPSFFDNLKNKVDCSLNHFFIFNV